MSIKRKFALLRPLNLLAGLIYCFLLLPTLIVIPISFDGSGVISFPPLQPSLKLYREFLFDPSWTRAALQSLIVAACSLAIALCIGVPAAFALGRRVFRGRNALSGLFIGPLVLPTVVIALGTYLFFSRLHLTGTTMGLVLAHAAFITPFVFVTVSAGLRQLDPLVETAAALMGAGWFTIFFRVTLPQLWHSVVSAALLAFLMSFDEVVIAWFITNATTVTLPVKMYSSIQWEVSPVLAAISTLLTAVSLLVCIVTYRIQSAEPPST